MYKVKIVGLNTEFSLYYQYILNIEAASAALGDPSGARTQDTLLKRQLL